MQYIPKKSTTINIAVYFLLATMAALMLVEAAQDTTIVDESPHIVAGYAYDYKQDYRLNPEHPPLIKMAAALPLGLLDVNFPEESTAWTQDVNGQWVLGDQFLHWTENNPVDITFFSRIGPIIITLLIGVLLFIWTRNLYGALAGLFALTLFAFSPNFIAHGHLVTTDVGAAFAFLFATYFFMRWLQKQNTKNLIWAGVAFGIAQLLKFSLILLVPFFGLVIIGWVLFRDRPLSLMSVQTLKKITVYTGKLVLIGLIGLLVVYPVYQYTVLNYPVERQLSDTTTILDSSPYPTAAKAVVWMADKPVLRAYSQFFLGHLMVFQRVSGGNTVYYLGDISNSAWLSYFPVVTALKVPLALLVMFSIATLVVLLGKYRAYKFATNNLKLKEKIKKTIKLKARWISEYFVELALLLMVVIYWASSMLGNLNIGVRHVLPTFPFLYIVLAGILHKWIHRKADLQNKNMLQQFMLVLRGLFRSWYRGGVIVILMLWYILSSLSVFPFHLTYFNELAGGPENGHKHVVDSNLDWGQDLGRLTDFVKQNNIDNIKVDYFGGGNPAYYLGNKYEQLNAFDETQRHGWIAVSATLMMNGRGNAIRGFTESTTHYNWLEAYEPVTVIGNSIFVYNIQR